MEKIYSRTVGLQAPFTGGFCPGCFHGVISKIVAESLEEMNLLDKAVCVIGVGCCCICSRYFDFDKMNAPHGRAPAVATGLKHATPEDTFVFTYQGDGDLASIGLSEIMYAANRGENISVIFVNNSTYGMTGGQMSPTTLVGQKATTSPYGRNVDEHGYPMHMCEILNQLGAPAFIERVSCDSPANILKAKKAVQKAFQNQLDKKGFSFVELMSSCPTNWGMTPLESVTFMREQTLKEYEIKNFRDR